MIQIFKNYQLVILIIRIFGIPFHSINVKKRYDQYDEFYIFFFYNFSSTNTWLYSSFYFNRV